MEFLKGDFFKELYSTLLHLSPLRFYFSVSEDAGIEPKDDILKLLRSPGVDS
jgi:hypothetical protein